MALLSRGAFDVSVSQAIGSFIFSNQSRTRRKYQTYLSVLPPSRRKERKYLLTANTEDKKNNKEQNAKKMRS